MDCKEFRDLLDLYVDGELSSEAIATANVHSSECQSCRRARAELLALRQALKTVVARHQVPTELVANVHTIFRSPWLKLLLGARSRAVRILGDSIRRPPTISKSHAQATAPLWKRPVSLPAPFFALLVLVIVALFLWSISLRSTKAPRADLAPLDGQTSIDPAHRRPAGEAFDISRYDRGQRATMYKVSSPTGRSSGSVR